MSSRISRDFRWSILAITILLTGIGLLNLYSALHSWGEAEYLHLFWSQCLWAAFGFVLMFVVVLFDYRLFDRLGIYLYVISIILLLAVLIFGRDVAGHKSWLGIGAYGVQPSEFAKVAVLLILAKFFSDNPNPKGYGFSDLFKPALFAFLPMAFVILQGDLGSAVFFVLIFFSLAWFAKIRGRTLFVMFIIGAVVLVSMYFFILSDYQRGRVKTFLNPDSDIRGQGYQIMQSKIAVGSGHLFGKGYLKGNVNKLNYLPEKHTDFVFPVLAEEWGFLGSLVTLVLYFLLFIIGIDVARKARDRFGIFLATGVVAYLFWQTAINIGGVLGIIPLTGVTLPLMSYGGSSVIAVMCSIGILLNIGLKKSYFG